MSKPSAKKAVNRFDQGAPSFTAARLLYHLETLPRSIRNLTGRGGFNFNTDDAQRLVTLAYCCLDDPASWGPNRRAGVADTADRIAASFREDPPS